MTEDFVGKMLCRVSSFRKKRSYRSINAALRAAAEFGNQYGSGYRPYQCRCGRWHLTTVRAYVPISA